jgi:5-methylcytosine-specific restriction endonuclease McrA
MSRTNRGECPCGNLVEFLRYDKNGNRIYRNRCSTCKRKGRRTKKDHCERCGFIPEDKCQLDVDHKNMNPADNRPKNLITLCANCHRLKTKLERELKHEKLYSLQRIKAIFGIS